MVPEDYKLLIIKIKLVHIAPKGNHTKRELKGKKKLIIYFTIQRKA